MVFANRDSHSTFPCGHIGLRDNPEKNWRRGFFAFLAIAFRGFVLRDAKQGLLAFPEWVKRRSGLRCGAFWLGWTVVWTSGLVNWAWRGVWSVASVLGDFAAARGGKVRSFNSPFAFWIFRLPINFPSPLPHPPGVYPGMVFTKRVLGRARVRGCGRGRRVNTNQENGN